MKKWLLLVLLLPVLSQAQFKGILDKAKGKLSTKNTTSALDISGGLKEALKKGVDEEVTKLTQTDGFYGNPSVKILFPEELQKVDKSLRRLGMSKLADDGVKSLNHAAELAVKEATPIFVDAITKMSIADAKNILMGSDNAATVYLDNTTRAALYAKFSPVVQESIGKVGADKIWSSIITKYNSVPLVTKVNPDITDYVTTKALEGVFKMIAVKEKDIRTNLSARTSGLLQKVFALQDKK